MVDVPVNEQVPSIVVDVVTNGQVAFAYPFRADDVGDLRAQYRPASGAAVDLVGGVGFTATGIGTATGGVITLTGFTATVAGAKLAIYRDIAIERTTDYSRDLFAADLNREQDNTYMILQQLQRDLGRAVKVAVGALGLSIVIGTAGQVPVFAADGSLIPSTPLGIGNMVREIYDPNSKAADLFDPAYAKGAASYFGAVGDGVVNDATKYALVEASGQSVYLGLGRVYNLGAAFNAKPVYGPGALKMGANTYAGNQLTYDPYRTEALFRPDSYYRKTGAFPAGSRHLNMIFSPSGPPASASVNRSTILGNANAMNAIALDRVDLIGDGAGRLMRYGERNTLVGNISGEQLGAPDTSQNNFWIDAGGFVPGDAGWDYQGLKTKNPTIGATIAAWIATNPFATVTTDVRAMVGLGRDTFNGSLKGQNSTAIGYQASASNLFPQGMTTIGTQANQYGIFTTNSFIGGYLAAVDWQEGTRGTAGGYQVVSSLVRGSQWTALGAFAGSNYTDLDDSILLGFGAGNGMSMTQANGLLAIGFSGNPLIGGNLKATSVGGNAFNGPNAGVNIQPKVIKGTFHIRTGDFGAEALAHVNADDLVIENSGNVGISLRTAANGSASIFVGIPGTTNKHGIIFNDSTGTFTIRVAGGDRLVVKSSGVLSFSGLPSNYANDAAAATGGLSVGDVYRNGSVLMVRAA